MRGITEITLSPAEVVGIAAQFTMPPDMVRQYARIYVDHSKEDETLTEYVRQASDGVFPGKFTSRGKIAEFRRALRNEIRRLERIGRGGF